ncbi:MAG: 1,4-alpha-glucan branching protein GlgB [Pseudarcicella sp.]|nr:1,4-alpha-glucan branching protein GlgB [Pseudarcicella sp.]MBP6410597.1 1,4-alpha-glucan branching protein GlgB [Pseudarcicella sp.]
MPSNTKKETTEKPKNSNVSEKEIAITDTPNSLKKVEPFSRFSDFDIELFKAGKHFRLFEKMGSHLCEHLGVAGTYFAVWAPSARSVSVIGNFNYWNNLSHQLMVRWDSSGIWEGFIPHIGKGEPYKFCIQTPDGQLVEKIDPYAHHFETPPRTASIVWDNWYEWSDNSWMTKRKEKNALNAPFSVYEVHIGSWLKKDYNHSLTYIELATQLVEYVKKMGFTHIEFMPVMEHPYEPSWGYQVLGFFAPSSRFGTPQDFMYLVEQCHKNDIGVILDWVPSHFPGDEHGLYLYDGTHVFEHPDPRKGYHPDWKSHIFNYGRNEVRSFLISNAVYWLERYHADGLRVDAVASMLYLDYSREAGEWEPNEFGGNHNLDAISFFKELNEYCYGQFPDIQIIAEESTSYTGVTKPVFMDGLGFGQKWMMGWMNDTLKYFEKDAAFRKYHQNDITFSTCYAFTENFMLPLSHDEVVYGKQALVNKMPGDEWQRFANLRLLFTYMFTHPGSKLLFMGGEFGQTSEWDFKYGLEWWLLEYAPHQGVSELIKTLNHLYKSYECLYENQFSGESFEWVDMSDHENSVIIYSRKNKSKNQELTIALNLTPVPRYNYRIGVNEEGAYKEVLNSDNNIYWGSGIMNEDLKTSSVHWQGKAYSLEVTLPPLAGVILKKK